MAEHVPARSALESQFVTRRLVPFVIGVGLLVAVVLLLRGTRSDRVGEDQPRARSLVLITIDTLRADHVGVYGAASVATPALDRIGRGGVRFERAFAPPRLASTRRG